MSKCDSCGHESADDFRFCPTCGSQVGIGDGDDPILGRTLNDKYRVLSKIGSGSMGSVYLGEHIGLKKKVALKVLHPDLGLNEEGLARFRQEGIAAGKFSHPNAIQIFDIDVGEGRIFYLAMEYVEGVDLGRDIRDGGAKTPRESIDIMRQVLSALASAHRQGIVHRDLKPDNIMISRGATGEFAVKVLDFGLSKLLDRPVDASLQTQMGRIMGTPLYMSPEQCNGLEVDGRTDIYSAGLILYEMLSGSTAFSGETVMEIFNAQMMQAAPPLPLRFPDLAIPADLDDIIRRAMEKERDARFASASEMQNALDGVRFDHIRKGGVTLFGRLRGTFGLAPQSQVPAVRRAAGSGIPRPVLAVAGLGALAFAAFLLISKLSEPDDPLRWRLLPMAERTALQQAYLSKLDEARSLLLRDDTEGALAVVNAALADELVDAEAYCLRAEVYRQKRDDRTARLDYEEAVRLDPGYGEALAGLGWLDLDAGQIEQAAAYFERAVDESNDPTAGQVGEAALALAEDRREEAVATLRQAIAQNPKARHAHRLLGEAFLGMGDAEDAVDAFVQAKRNDLHPWRALIGLSQAYLALDQFEPAEKELRDAVRLNPEATEARLLLASLMATDQRYSDALLQVEEGLRLEPGVSALHFLAGSIHSERGDEAQAILAIEKALAAAAEAGEEPDPRAHELLAVLRLAQGDAAGALQACEASLAAGFESARLLLNHGLALFRLQRLPEARASLARSIELDDGLAYAHFAMGILQMEYVGDMTLARQHFDRYRELGGDDPRIAGWLGR